MPNPENVIGKGRKFTSGDDRTAEAGRKGGLKRAANVNLQKTMTKILGAQPNLTESMIENMQKRGLDISDSEVTNTAALIGLVLTNKALAGDIEAARMVFEMAGQVVDGRTANERERVKLEKQRLRFLERGNAASAASIPVLIDTRPDETAAESGDASEH